MQKDLHEQNRLAWNAATRAHNSHKADQAQFLRNGGSTLFPEELDLLGDIAGLSLVHLQCNAGQDTLSLARRGAIVTGVDISDEAIAFARQLSADSGIPGTFQRADIYDWLEEGIRSGKRFDLAFSSYGALIWLSDLCAWAQGIAGILAPGGRLILVEFHPFLAMLDEKGRQVVNHYGGGRLLSFVEGIGDYVAWAGPVLAPSGYLEGVQDFHNPHPGHEFNWALSEVITALLEAGLRLETLREYPYANGFPAYEGTRLLPGGRYGPAEGQPSIPLMYCLSVRKQA